MKVLGLTLLVVCLVHHSSSFVISDVLDYLSSGSYSGYKHMICPCLKLPTFEKLQAKLRDISGNNPSKMTLKSIGTTKNGLEIPHVILSSGSAANKPIILVDSLVHGDEKLPLFATMNMIDRLLTPKYAHFLKSIEWHFVPVVNPDGFVADTRKNAADVNGECHGVDLNRNFANATDASSQEICNRDYSVVAFSEPESRAMKTLFEKFGDRIKYYVGLHGCHENRIIPVIPSNPDRSSVQEVKSVLRKAEELALVGNVKGVGYSVRSPKQLNEEEFPEASLYEVQEAPNGNALTYAVDKAGVQKAFVFGHAPDQDELEVMDGVWFMMQNIALEFLPGSSDKLASFDVKEWSRLSGSFGIPSRRSYYARNCRKSACSDVSSKSSYLNQVMTMLQKVAEKFEFPSSDSLIDHFTGLAPDVEIPDVSEVWSQFQDLATQFQNLIDTQSLYEKFSSLDDHIKQEISNNWAKMKDQYLQFGLITPESVYAYFSDASEWTQEKANEVLATMQDLSSKVKAMTPEEFTNHFNTLDTWTRTQVAEYLSNMGKAISSVEFPAPESLQKSLSLTGEWTHSKASEVWSQLQDLATQFQTLVKTHSLYEVFSSMDDSLKQKISDIWAQMKDQFSQFDLITPESAYAYFSNAREWSQEKANEVLSTMQDLSSKVKAMTPEEFTNHFNTLDTMARTQVTEYLSNMRRAISSIEFPAPETLHKSLSHTSEWTLSKANEVYNSMTSLASIFDSFDVNSVYNYFSNVDDWTYAKASETLGMMKDVADNFGISSPSDLWENLSSMSSWSNEKASELSTLMHQMSENFKSYTPQTLYENFPSKGDFASSKDKIIEEIQKLKDSFYGK